MGWNHPLETLKKRWQNHQSEVVPHRIRNLTNRTGKRRAAVSGEGWGEDSYHGIQWDHGTGWGGDTNSLPWSFGEFLEVKKYVGKCQCKPCYLLMVKNSQTANRLGCIPKPCKSWDFNYQPQLVTVAGLLNHQLYDCFESCGSLKWFFGNGHIQKPAVQASLVDPLVTQKTPRRHRNFCVPLFGIDPCCQCYFSSNRFFFTNLTSEQVPFFLGELILHS